MCDQDGVIRVSHDIVTHEKWSNIAVGDPVTSDDKFTWSPPADWRKWRKTAYVSTLKGGRDTDLSLLLHECFTASVADS